MRSPVAFPFRGRWLAVGQTDEGNDPGGWSVSRRRGAQCAPAGRSGTGPYENNAVAPISAVGAGPRPARKPSPCKGKGRFPLSGGNGRRPKGVGRHGGAVTDEGDFLACPRRAAQCAAPTEMKDCLRMCRSRWHFGFFAAMGKGTRRPQAAKFPASDFIVSEYPISPKPSGGTLHEAHHSTKTKS